MPQTVAPQARIFYHFTSAKWRRNQHVTDQKRDTFLKNSNTLKTRDFCKEKRHVERFSPCTKPCSDGTSQGPITTRKNRVAYSANLNAETTHREAPESDSKRPSKNFFLAISERFTPKPFTVHRLNQSMSV